MSHNTIPWEYVLSAAGHRVTRQRAAILDAVCEGHGHTPIGEIYLRARRHDPHIDRSTVYRTLRLFTELGIVVTADTGDAETYYEVAKPRPHHHLVCRQCGREIEIDHSALTAMFGQIEQQYGFHVVMDHLVLFGLCQECAQSGARPT
jgi:Fe2+ or Zn2+ uptake regulation protein